ncbi:hypothetical protein BDB01DRAFT_847837 [Pilobolus umbonatus]|nr:hypothetical protein BDB01DRAFT_847837 [Pilobolus umbonatus]
MPNNNNHRNKNNNEQTTRYSPIDSPSSPVPDLPRISHSSSHINHSDRSPTSGHIAIPPPPYDPLQQSHTSPGSSIHWTSEMSALADKIKDDLSNSFNKGKLSTADNIDRHSISQGMKLISIATDEYELGNQGIALNIFLTGIDKILMALPNKTDIDTKLAIRDKLQKLEERVGIVNDPGTGGNPNDNTRTLIQPYILSTITSVISTLFTTSAGNDSNSSDGDRSHRNCSHRNTCQSMTPENMTAENVIKEDDTRPYSLNERDDSIVRFKRFGQLFIQLVITCAILLKKSPLPSLISLMITYIIQLMMWIDAEYNVNMKVQKLGVQCIKLGLQVDEEYHLHEYLSEGVYMIVAALLKAMVAFKETPPSSDNSRNRNYPTKLSSPSVYLPNSAHKSSTVFRFRK